MKQISEKNHSAILIEISEIKRRLENIDRHLEKLNNQVSRNVLEIEKTKVNKYYWMILTITSNIAVATISFLIFR